MKSCELTVQRIKGESVFNSISYIDIVLGFTLDYLHKAVLGVTAQIWSVWNKKYLTPGQRKDVDDSLFLRQ